MNDQTNLQTNHPKEQIQNKKHFLVPLLLIFLLVIATGAVYFWQHNEVTSLNKQLGRYKQLVSMPNQACLGLTKASDNDVVFSSINLNTMRQLYANDPDNRTASFTCAIGKNTKDFTKGMDVAQVDSNGYEMGAEVIYFDSPTSAKKYAEKKINPLRYWSLDQQGQQEGVPQSSKFTSLINVSQPYFDSYTVKENALVRVSLPCEFTATFVNDPWKCGGQAADTSVAYYTIKSFSESIKQLNF